MMQPRLSSIVERRLLVNHRVDPQTAARLIPAPLRPHLVRGHAVAGICLLRLGSIRPSWVPQAVGLRSENAAHRFAVEWDGPDGAETGVYIPRRDTASRLNAWAGGRFFPGEHHLADFQVRETRDVLRVAFDARDRTARVDVVDVAAVLTDDLSTSELFTDLDEASEFFRRGARGFSATRTGSRLDGMTLHTDTWRVEACEVRSAESSYFDDPNRFPPGSATLDCAVVMRNLPATWQPLPSLATD
ncbi:DUF2071 domain-containing protein [Streptomyces sp. H10-C2]|uniref:DUF2071 domain-containing protein n=1 Tax=unclassified Streptomyces TaxID=2593676 RepID=UPI0024B9B065|nr:MULTISPECIES: DUF2071 domain-containing protein [unclassified Streptomyces]MDJ0345138.1 DUF2071 domain-containing protein [Streptomyces sp. PH10-H1]MDJ0374106.1 DUF2071 domain-containing protein [Streptomyces sp. H10-C2]